MGGAYYILMINLALGLVVLVAFAGIWFYDRSRPGPALLTLSVLAFLLGGALELLAPFVSDGSAPLLRYGLYTANYTACALLSLGVLAHYGLSLRLPFVLGFSAAALVIFAVILDWPRQSVLRMALNQVPLAVMAGLAPLTLVASPVRLRWMDRLLVLAVMLFALNLLARPALLWLYGTMGENPALYHTTRYALISQFAMAVLTMTAATVMMLILVVDVVADLRAQRDTDRRTGLLNADGFAAALTRLVDSGARAGPAAPVAVIVAGIDRWESLCAVHGERAVARLEDCLAHCLAEALSREGSLGRLAPGTMAVAVPRDQADGVTLRARSRFAEAMRGILPAGELSTASFAVVADVTDARGTLDAARAAIVRSRTIGLGRAVDGRTGMALG